WAGHLTAQTRGREDLSRVAEIFGVEGAAQALHRVEVGRAEHLRHVLLLVGTDTVLTRDGSPVLQAYPEDLGRNRFRVLRFALHPAIVEDQRVQVAVSRVKDVG